MSHSAVLAAHDLGWVVGGAVILTEVTLDVAGRELLAVIGPNGAGKSTLLHLLSGVRMPTSGRVELGGRDVTRESVAQRARQGMGRTFQTSSLFGGLARGPGDGATGRRRPHPHAAGGGVAGGGHRVRQPRVMSTFVLLLATGLGLGALYFLAAGAYAAWWAATGGPPGAVL